MLDLLAKQKLAYKIRIFEKEKSMLPMQYIKLFMVTLCCLFVLDMIWLGYIAKSLYIESYKPWFRLEDGKLHVIVWAAGIVYLLLAAALVIFVIPLAHGSMFLAFFYGAAMGCIIYGVYDMTCFAIFKDWPLAISLIDWVWGTVLCACVAVIGTYFALRMNF